MSYDYNRCSAKDDTQALVECIADTAADGVVRGLQKNLKAWGFSDKEYQFKPELEDEGSSSFEVKIRTPSGEKKFRVQVTRARGSMPV
jgi:hypothetical protein